MSEANFPHDTSPQSMAPSLSAFQKFSGRGLDQPKRLARLLHFRELALEADLQCKWKKSDFFWSECLCQLRKLSHDTTVWARAAAFLDSKESSGAAPEDLKNAFADRYFVKSFLGLQQAAQAAWPDNPKPESREFVYVKFLRETFDIIGTSPTVQAPLVIPLVDRLVEAQVADKKWQPAIQNIKDMVVRFPDEKKYPEKQMLLEFKRAVDTLPQGKPFQSSDAKRLKEAIDNIEQLRAQHPAVSLPFSLIGRLRHYRAIAMANTEDLSGGIAESLRALDYLPGDEDITKTHNLLIEKMKALKEKMAAVQREIRYGYNKRLTYEGQRNLNDANRGFSPLEEYSKSSERAQIQKAANTALNKQIWLSIYPEPASDWSESSEKLVAALAAAFEAKPSSPGEITPLWATLAENEPRLAHLDPKPAVKFLTARLFPDQAENESAPISERSREGIPVYHFQSTKETRSEEPFLFWLFGHQGTGLKVTAALALVLLLSSLTAWLFDSYRKSREDQAYSALMIAARNADYPAVVTAAEDFLSHRPLLLDERTPQVKSLYAEGLVRWFSQLPDKPDDAALTHVRRYRQLISQTQTQ